MLALWAHGINERLVAIAQIHRTPLGSVGDFLAGPGAVRQVDVFYLDGEGLIALVGHGGAALLIPRGLSFAAWAGGGGDVARGADERISGGHEVRFPFLRCLCETASWAWVAGLRDGALASA